MMIRREDAQFEFGAGGGGGFHGGRLFGVVLAGSGYKNCGRVCAISETLDCRPVPQGLLIAFFKTHLGASIFI
jgi:hypothetical protein